MRKDFRRLTIKEYISILSQLPYESEVEFIERRLSVVLRQPIDSIKSLPYTILMDYKNKLEKVENDLQGLRVKDKVKVNGKWFKVDHDIMKINAAQFIDASHFSKNAEKELHNFIAVFLRPMTWRFGKASEYNGTNHKDIADLVLNKMKVEQALPLLVFFCEVLQELSNHIETYLIQETKKLIEDLPQNGDILSRLTTYQTEMLLNGNISLK